MLVGVLVSARVVGGSRQQTIAVLGKLALKEDEDGKRLHHFDCVARQVNRGEVVHHAPQCFVHGRAEDGDV